MIWLIAAYDIFLKIATIVGLTTTFRNTLTPSFKNLPQALFIRIRSGFSLVSDMLYLIFETEYFEKFIFLTVILSKSILFSVTISS